MSAGNTLLFLEDDVAGPFTKPFVPPEVEHDGGPHIAPDDKWLDFNFNPDAPAVTGRSAEAERDVPASMLTDGLFGGSFVGASTASQFDHNSLWAATAHSAATFTIAADGAFPTPSQPSPPGMTSAPSYSRTPTLGGVVASTTAVVFPSQPPPLAQSSSASFTGMDEALTTLGANMPSFRSVTMASLDDHLARTQHLRRAFSSDAKATQIFFGQLPSFLTADHLAAAIDVMLEWGDAPRLVHLRPAASQQAAHALLTAECDQVKSILALNRRAYFTEKALYYAATVKDTPVFQRLVSKALNAVVSPNAVDGGNRLARACVVVECANRPKPQCGNQQHQPTPTQRGGAPTTNNVTPPALGCRKAQNNHHSNFTPPPPPYAASPNTVMAMHQSPSRSRLSPALLVSQWPTTYHTSSQYQQQHSPTPVAQLPPPQYTVLANPGNSGMLTGPGVFIWCPLQQPGVQQQQQQQPRTMRRASP